MCFLRHLSNVLNALSSKENENCLNCVLGQGSNIQNQPWKDYYKVHIYRIPVKGESAGASELTEKNLHEFLFGGK